jgi:flagellar motor switch/type III secretory pathway protein FliN
MARIRRRPSIAASEAALLSLAGLMLDRRIDPPALTPADRSLVERLWTGCIEDLCKRLSETLRLPPASRWQLERSPAPPPVGAHSCYIGTGPRDPLIQLSVDWETMVALTKASIPFGQKPVRLQPLAAALAKQPIAVSALVGRCELTLADLAGLGEGDVVVLDRDLGLPLELAVGGEVKSGRCEVVEADERLSLKITEPVQDK